MDQVQANGQPHVVRAGSAFKTALQGTLSSFGRGPGQVGDEDGGFSHLLILRAAQNAFAALAVIRALVGVARLSVSDGRVLVNRVRADVFTNQRQVPVRLSAGMLVVRTASQSRVREQQDNGQGGHSSTQHKTSRHFDRPVHRTKLPEICQLGERKGVRTFS